ncbi:MAG: hypothetical protein IJC07_04685 [Clostridia bacterium]|nr:hypothetical protein [Clostridia bacterium]
MTKKLVSLIVGLMLTLACSLGFFFYGKSLNGFKVDAYSETFTGYVSERTYSTKEETAQQFLAKELSGETIAPSMESVSTVRELSSAELDKIKAEHEFTSNVVSGEEVEVKYVNGTATAGISPYAMPEYDYVFVYILLTENGDYYYFVPLQAKGQPLANSYYASVVDAEKYRNCTTTVKMQMVVEGEEPLNQSVTQVIEFGGDVARLGQPFGSDWYFKDTGYGIEPYLQHPQRNDGKYYSASEINSESVGIRYEFFIQTVDGMINIDNMDGMEDLVSLVFALDVDASYFVKTDYGFCIPNEKCREVAQKMFIGNAPDLSAMWEDYNIYFNAEYYVTEGRLSASKVVLTMCDDTNTYSYSAISTYTKFGQTKVSIPGREEA